MEGLSDLPAKLLSQCGLVSGILVAAVIWLALQLAKARQVSETDRATFVKMMNEQNVAYEKMAVSHSKLEGMLLALQVRSAGDDN